MSSEPAVRPSAQALRARPPRSSLVVPTAAALAVAATYLVGMWIGSALTAPGSPISTLWPPNALLMAAFILAPRRFWPLFLVVLLPVHVVFQRQLGLPLGVSLGWFAGNTGEALLGAAFVRSGTGEGERVFESTRGVIRFVLLGALLAPLVTSFLDAAVVQLAGLGSDYWSSFSVRLFSNALAIVLFVPPIVMAFDGGFERLRRSSFRRQLEAAAIVAGAVAVCLVVDTGEMTVRTIPLELYAPLPIFVWAAMRFGPWESSVAVLAVTLAEIWSSIHGRGPFAIGTPAENVLSLQTYSALVAIPLLLFAVTMEERRKIDRRLRRNEERLQLAFEVSRMAHWDWDLRTGEVSFFERNLGFYPTSIDLDLPRAFGVVHPDDREEVQRIHEEAVRDVGSYEVECRVFDESGGVHWIHRKGQVVADGAGRPVRVYGVTIDITDRKKNEEALAEAEKIGILARGAARIAIWSLDFETGEVYAEKGLPSLLGIDSASGRSLDFWLSRIYEADRVGLIATKRYILDPGAPVDERGETPIPELEYRIHHADGSLRWFLTRGTVIRGIDGSPRRIVGTAIDVTDRKMAELEALQQRRELTHLARVSAVGELSGALAHEMNQPLTSILANAQAARRMIDREPADLAELRKILDDIVSEDRRAGEVIRHLRNLLRKEAGEVERVDMSELVDEMLELTHGDFVARGIALRTFLAPDLPAVLADRVQLQQVLLNLILNACDAMSETPSEERVLTVTSVRQGSGVLVSVADTGTGITPDRMEVLFKPFFTTKPNGLGLGLAICRSIVQAADGRLWAENNAERGSTFRFLIPCAEKETAAS
jgi:PAS domain S-box-containing protein